MPAATDKKTDAAVSAKKPVKSKKKVVICCVLALALVVAYFLKPAGMGKKEIMQKVKAILISMQALREHGPLGWFAFIGAFVVSLVFCLPVTTLLDAALGNIYGAFLGTVASLVSKLLGALMAIFIGRRCGKMLGLELPEALLVRMATVRTHPFTCLLFARMTPCSTGVKNYAFSLLPTEDVPILQYSAAVIGANVFFTASICTVAANADNLVSALDHVMGA